MPRPAREGKRIYGLVSNSFLPDARSSAAPHRPPERTPRRRTGRACADRSRRSPAAPPACVGRRSASAISVASVNTTYAGTFCSRGDPRPPLPQPLVQLLVDVGRAGRAAAQLAVRAGQQRRAADPAGRHLASADGRVSDSPARARALRRRRARSSCGRNRHGRRGRPPGDRGCAVRQPEPLPGPGDPDVEQPALLLQLRRASSRTWSAACPSASPTRNTASHSRPLAECSEASVTPSTVGACCCSARRASSSQNAGETSRCTAPACRSATRLRAYSSASATSAASASHCSRAAPPGGRLVAAPSRSRDSASTTASTSGVSPGIDRTAGAQRDHRLPHLGPLEEPLGAAHHVRHPGLGQRLLVRLGLRVGPEQHRDLAGRGARARSARAQRRGHRGRLGRLVGEDLAAPARRRAAAARPAPAAAWPRCPGPAGSPRWPGRPPAGSSGSRGPAGPPTASRRRRGKSIRYAEVAPVNE